MIRPYLRFPALARLARDDHGEEGMVSLVSLLAILGLLLLFALVANVGLAIKQKLEVQNAADAVAISASVEMARGLNSLTAANHLIGELTALVILHHAFGGDELDEGRKPKQTPADIRVALELMYDAAKVASSLGKMPRPVESAYDRVRKEPEVGAALRDSRLRLKQVLTWAYTAHAIGGFIVAIVEKIPAIGPILSGITQAAIIYPAMTFQYKACQECLVMEGLELLARVAVIPKQVLREGIVPGISAYSSFLVWQAPRQMEKAAEVAGEAGRATGRLYPGWKNTSYPLLTLPVRWEPAGPAAWQRSPLVRATTPWVQYWRVPWLRFGQDALLLSRFKCHFWDRTDEFTRTITDQLREKSGVQLYILTGWEPDGVEKGKETWTRAEGSRNADRLFSLVGFAHRGSTPSLAGRIFRRTNPNGTATFAQGMAYNANRRLGLGSSGSQPILGWDTLNWTSRVLEYPGDRPRDPSYPIPEVVEPQIRLNWQAKLVPTTRLAESIFWQTGDLGRQIRRTPLFPTALGHTH